MKIFLGVLLFFLSLDNLFALEPSSYEFYQNTMSGFCKPSDPGLWSQWKEGNFLTVAEVQYANISNGANGDATYKTYLKSINADPSRIDTLGFGFGPKYLEKASYVYKETMNAIYACAVMNTRVRIIKSMLKIPTTQSNMTKKLEDQLKQLQGGLVKNGCRLLDNTAAFSFKKTLLDNTTYQYCTYRQYLYYLDNASRASLGAYYKNSPQTGSEASGDMKNTDSASIAIARSRNKLIQEITHVKEIYPQAMVAFNEFEKTYASHIVLVFILEDYIKLRDSLKKLMNPIGQLIYKISNAQKP